MSTVAAPAKNTEADMLRLPQVRHAGDKGNGPEWAYMEHVRNAAGFAATRTADAMALHLWPGRGHELHGFEVKVSRADWRRELKDSAKAEGWHEVVDRWWIVAPKGVVSKDELPPTWGLLEANEAVAKLAVKVQAPSLRSERRAISRGLLACFLRAAGAGLACSPEQLALDTARAEGIELGKQRASSEGPFWQTRYEEAERSADASRAVVRHLSEALGVGLRDGWGEEAGSRAAQVAAAVRVVLRSEDAAVGAITRLTDTAERLEDEAKRLRSLTEAAGAR